MASLQLNPAPSPWGCQKKLPTTKLERYYLDDTDMTQHYSICDLKLLTSHKNTAVYKGTLTLPDKAGAVSVVVKTDFFAESPRPSAFEHEADMYELHLWDLQDKAIPHCYGLFQYDGEDGKVSSFLVLGDCGTPIEDPRNFTDSYKSKVIDAVYFIHFAGFTHGDLSYHNILNKDGCPFIIDFETAKPHVCGMKEKVFIVRAWADVDVKLEGVYTFLRMDLRRGNIDYLLSRLAHYTDNASVYRPYVEELVEQVEAEREHYRNMPQERRLIVPE
ncbi:hypothetical protein PLEOSDRAFT_153466 [Pleurotus ostreatus PC15]|uniref:Non-specific serine/threonine protein kinase n=1 Tax=Pleurotus ostreatus (strain PC15) TaxID=1137138 RepID=A0A067P0Y6_PLEO1|nr:hypothetical protein PLEOSDRAFT_153466 [Pleurotus ostreatus PC15]